MDSQTIMRAEGSDDREGPPTSMQDSLPAPTEDVRHRSDEDWSRLPAPSRPLVGLGPPSSRGGHCTIDASSSRTR